MNKKISTRVGLITGLFILCFIIFLKQIQMNTDSPIVTLQFLFLFVGILASCFVLYRYYADITLLDTFKHCLRTLATIIVIMAFGNAILFFVIRSKDEPMSNLTIILGYTLFAYSLSGLMSSLVASFIFNTFTKKK